jgi:hypothetical protein
LPLLLRGDCLFDQLRSADIAMELSLIDADRLANGGRATAASANRKNPSHLNEQGGDELPYR